MAGDKCGYGLENKGYAEGQFKDEAFVEVARRLISRHYFVRPRVHHDHVDLCYCRNQAQKKEAGQVLHVQNSRFIVWYRHLEAFDQVMDAERTDPIDNSCNQDE